MRRLFRWLIKSSAAQQDDEMAWFFPPSDVHSAGPWDQYWRGQLEHGIGPPLHDMFCDDDALLDAIAERGLRTVLCVGNGISQEPHALAAAGLHVTALDISPFAMHLASELTLGDTDVGRFFNGQRTRPGGSVRFEVGDLLDPAVCPGPFDVVIERRTLQLFAEVERTGALMAVASRLSERGVLVTHCHDGRWKPPASPLHVVEPLLKPHGFQVLQHGSSTPADGRVAIVVMSTG